MKDISHFADVVGIPSRVGSLDASGSTIDQVFADAILANEPVTVLEESGILRVQTIPPEVDKAIFPIAENTELTWVTINRDVNDTGSDFAASLMNPVQFIEITPKVRTANIFLPDNVSLVNKASFDLQVQIASRDTKRKMDTDGLASLFTLSEAVQVFAATSRATSGSVGTGSLLRPSDLVHAKKLLKAGNFHNVADFALMEDTQYEQLNTSNEFAPGAGGASTATAGAIMRKAKFNEVGDLVGFAGMDIVSTDLVPSTGSTSLGADLVEDRYAVLGHGCIVGKKGLVLGRARHTGVKISTEDSRRRHGQWKVLDLSYEHRILAGSAFVHITCSDT